MGDGPSLIGATTRRFLGGVESAKATPLANGEFCTPYKECKFGY